MLGIYVLFGAFLGIIIPTVLISLLPALSIRILESLSVYRKGSLSLDVCDYITGAGYYRKGKVFTYIDENGSSRFESGRVFGLLTLLFLPLMIIISIIVFLVL